MRVIGLVSGGKDSCYNLMKCVQYGHEIVALANLRPPVLEQHELDSFMFQTVGHTAIDAYAEALGLPLYRGSISGQPKKQSLEYEKTVGDEVESLYELIEMIKSKHPQVEAVACGAILSTYQRNRVENVCARLGLVSLSFLWQRDQKELLREMIDAGVEAVLIKVAALGLDPKRHLGKSIAELFPTLCQLNETFGIHICGEGGEYETFTLDCPLFKKRIRIDKARTVMHTSDPFAPVAYLDIQEYHLEDKKGGDAPCGLAPVSGVVQRAAKPRALSVQRKGGLAGVLKCSSSAQGPVTFIGGLRAAEQTAPGPPSQQMREIMRALQEVLASKSLSMQDLFFVWIYLADIAQFSAVNAVYGEWFPFNPPSRATIELPLADCDVLVECLALGPLPPLLRSKQPDTGPLRSTLHVQSISEWAPACIGPYAQANKVGRWLVLAGQIPLNPLTMQLSEGDVTAQTRLIVRNTAAILPTFACQFNQITSCTVFLTNAFTASAAVEALVQTLGRLPFAFVVQVPRLPKDADLEIQFNCHLSSSPATPLPPVREEQGRTRMGFDGLVAPPSVFLGRAFLSISNDALHLHDVQAFVEFISRSLAKVGSAPPLSKAQYLRVYFNCNRVAAELLQPFVVSCASSLLPCLPFSPDVSDEEVAFLAEVFFFLNLH